jgi:predicted nucleic acid-binding Zn ribbon protein
MKKEIKEKIKNTLLKKYHKTPENISQKQKKITNRIQKYGECVVCGKKFNKPSYKKTCCEECYKVLVKTNTIKQQAKKHEECYKYYLEHQEEFCRPNYIPKQFKPEKIEQQGGVCAICGIKPEWNGKPLVFIMDHIDGDASNNKWKNLRCICHNCDSQLDTYKSKNKNSKRINYLREKIKRELLNNLEDGFEI